MVSLYINLVCPCKTRSGIFFYLIVLGFFLVLFPLQKKEPVGDESIPEDVLNLDDLTVDTLAVSYCTSLF